VAVFGTNLLDKKYINSTIALTNVLGFSTETPGAPRMVGVELRVPFGAQD
jgi:outer membrane receptor protein involved in Fe transport